MQKLTLGIIIFFFLTTSNAQVWAPVGAKWTYEFQNWYPPFNNSPSVIECVGDTIIEGKPCRIIEGSCSCGFNHQRSFHYYENDKVYLYIDSIVGFTLLYDFTAKPGDIWTIIPPQPFISDSFKVRVDSIGTRVFSGNTFNIQYINNINSNDFCCFCGIVIDGIGHFTCLYPMFATCDPWSRPLRCYEDSSGLIKFKDIPCDTVIYMSEDEIHLSQLINIYPNPAKSELFIEFQDLIDREYTIEIYSIPGQLQFKQRGIKNNIAIDISRLNKGLYFIRISDTKHSFISKFIKE